MAELKDRLRADLTSAMKSQDKLRTATLRMVLAAIQTEEVAGKESRELSDEEVIKVLSREAKKRSESAEKDAVAYGYAVVESPAERPVEVRAASATAVKIFVNGREVLAREFYHQSFDQDALTAPAQLRKGRNTILVKVCQNNQAEAWAQNWMYQLRLTDALGAAVPLTVLAAEAAGKEAP